MQDFLIQYGLIAIFLCALIENDVVFIMTGVAIHFAAVHPVFAFLACLAGALVHDSIWFTIGHKRSASINSTGNQTRRSRAVYRTGYRHQG